MLITAGGVVITAAFGGVTTVRSHPLMATAPRNAMGSINSFMRVPMFKLVVRGALYLKRTAYAESRNAPHR